MTSPLPDPPPRPRPPCHRADALAVVRGLHEAGHTAYFAGGCVRDTLLGLPPKDWDIATDAPPQRVRQIFTDTQAVGAAFGVILVRRGASVVEVATFRADNRYEDGRRPTGVRFTNAQEDAQRRDFSINGLFYDPLEDRVIDYVGGRADLEARRLRAIGEPAQRFEEDHLRLLRAVRFAARFDLQIEPRTAAAIGASATRLRGISPERVGDELRLMLTSPRRGAAWELIWSLGLGPTIFRFLPKMPENSIDMQRSIFLNIAPGQTITMGLALAAAVLCVRLQAETPVDIVSLLSKPQVGRGVRAMRQALRISNAESDEMADTLLALEPLLAAQAPSLAQKKRFAAAPTALQSMAVMEGLAAVNLRAERVITLRDELAALRSAGVPAPLVSGDDLITAGFVPGPRFKQILEFLYDAQLEGRLLDKQQAIELARQFNT